MGVGGQHHAPAPLPPVKTRYPLYKRLGGPQSRSDRVRNISSPPGFHPWTVQPVASRYTDCAIPGRHFCIQALIICLLPLFVSSLAHTTTKAVCEQNHTVPKRPVVVTETLGRIRSYGSHLVTWVSFLLRGL